MRSLPLKTKGSISSYQLVNYIIAGIIVMIIAYSGIFSPVRNNYPVRCVHEQLTGMSCPSCGISHSFSYMIRGDIKQALEWNSYGPRVFLFFLFQLVLRMSNIFFLKRRPGDIRWLVFTDIILSVLSFGLAFSQFAVYNYRMIFQGPTSFPV